VAFHSVSFDAIGVRNQVIVTEPAALDRAGEIARHETAALDEACSRFRDDSELVALNASAGTGNVPVSPLLFEAIETALRVAAATEGLVDPTIGPAMRGLGYDRDFDVVVAGGPRPSFTLVPATGWRLGGDIAVAGSPPGGWPVRVSDSHRDTKGGQVVAIRNGGLASSSTTVRRWRAGDVELHHIVDPRTGTAAPEVWRTATVTAPTCVEANAAATAAIILGAAAPNWLAQRDRPARLVRRDGSVAYFCGWPGDRS